MDGFASLARRGLAQRIRTVLRLSGTSGANPESMGSRVNGEMDSGLSPAGCPGMTACLEARAMLTARNATPPKKVARAGIRLRRRRLGLGGACLHGRKRRSDTGSGLLMTAAHTKPVRRAKALRIPRFILHARSRATASLQSTEMAERLYAAVGFCDLGRFLGTCPKAARTFSVDVYVREYQASASH